MNNYDEYIKDIIRLCEIYSKKEMFYSVYEKYQNKTLDIRDGYNKKIAQIDKTLSDINNKLDKMYMDRLEGILHEEDFVRISEKFNFERTKLNEQKQELEQKLNGTDDKSGVKNKRKEERRIFLEDRQKAERDLVGTSFGDLAEFR